MTEERFFYHSFPRPRNGIDSLEQGKRILELIADHGLVLAPEMLEFSESLQDGSKSAPIKIFQKRICFTELSPKELPEHAEAFGPISLEWDLAKLRIMGAIPVFYVSLDAPPNSLEGIGASLVARLADIQTVLSRIEDLSSVANNTLNPLEPINITKNGVPEFATRLSVGGAIDLIQFLEYQSQPVSSLTASARALAGYFYPIENLDFTEPLGYYRQREWRVLANMLQLGEPVTHQVPEEVQKKLIAVSSDFWGKEIDFPTGKFQRVDQSQLFSHFASEPVISSVRRVIAPAAACDSIRELLKQRKLAIPVKALEDL